MIFRGLFKEAGERIYRRFGKELPVADTKVRMVLNVTDPSLMDLTPTAFTVLIEKTNSAQPITTQNFFVQTAALVAGPKQDGTTPNAAIVFVGGRSVGLDNGFPLVAGAPSIGGNVTVGPCNLNKLFVIGTAGDAVRVLVFA